MSTPTEEQLRFVRIENELRFGCSAERLFAALTTDTLAWFPHTYGEQRTQGIVIEPRVGGLDYEDWGSGAGHLYGQGDSLGSTASLRHPRPTPRRHYPRLCLCARVR